MNVCRSVRTCIALVAPLLLMGCPLPTDTMYEPELPPNPVAVKSIAQSTPQSEANSSVATGDAGGSESDAPPSPSLTPGYVKTLAGSAEEGDDDGEGDDARFAQPSHIARGDANTLYIVDTGNHQIRQVSLDTNEVTTVAGSEGGNADGSAYDVRFRRPGGIAVGTNVIYIADTRNHLIRKIDLTKEAEDSGYVTTLAGDGTAGDLDGDALDAQFNEPRGLALDEDINALFVADSLNHSIRRINLLDMSVTTLAGESSASDAAAVDHDPDFQDDVASAARFDTPYDVKLSRAGDLLYVADYGNHRIRAIDILTQTVTTLAGSGDEGLLDGKGADAQFRGPAALSVDMDGNVWVADRENHCIRKVTPRGHVTTEVGTGAAGDTDGVVTEARLKLPAGVYASRNVYITTDTMLRLVQFP